ncbi:MAG: filamentous hemagglutinin N-terminal domain-containing protein, partial [Gammaproteobacteria bacterium]
MLQPVVNKSISLLLLCVALALNSYSWANPTGSTVTAGSATVIQAPGKTQINQSTNKAIINWQTFSINKGELTQFNQPSKSSVTLNRVIGINGTIQRSLIDGTLRANGQIFLLNPAGIVFTTNAIVDVAGLMASTLNMTDSDFMSGNYRLSGNSNAAIVNNGFLKAQDSGFIGLFAASVQNNGVIKANLGTVALGAGKAFTLDFLGNQLINFQVDAPVDSKGDYPDAILNGAKGRILANGGTVIVSARAAKGVVDNVINMKGIVQAHSAVQRNGNIVLMGGSEGVVKVSGKMMASGISKGTRGGKIRITGQRIALVDTAVLDASGDIGGGEILIGGNAHGKGPLQNAENLYVDRNVNIKADAVRIGNGGTVVNWSDLGTAFYGNISARGGLLGGNGGWVEVSGGNLNYDGFVDTRAPKGLVGSLLLDPKFLIIQTSGGSAYSAGSNNLFANNTSGTNTLTPASIVTAAASANITLQANSDVIFNNALTITGAGTSGRTLTVTAGRSILVNANVSTNNGVITMTANSNTATSADRSIVSTGNPVGDTETTAGNITLANGVTISSGTTATSLIIGSTTTAPFTPGSITQGATGGITANGITFNVPTTTTGSIGSIGTPMLTTNTGTITLTSGSGGAFITNTGSFTLATPTLATNNPLTIKSTGVLTLPAAALSVGTGSIDFQSNGGLLSTAGTLTTTTGNINLTSSALLTINNNLTTGSGTTISLNGVGVTLAGTPQVNAGAGASPTPGNITVNAGSGTFTMPSGGRLLAGDSAGTAGTITITARNIALNTSGTPSQIGGTSSGVGYANSVILKTPAATTIGIAGGAGTFAL